MKELMLFADGSVDIKSKIGYGAYLSVQEYGLSLDLQKAKVKVKRFEETNSTKLELQTLLWALNDINFSGKRIIVYTDSQNIIGLQGRRERFEQSRYHSRKNELINNHLLYKDFYNLTDEIDCEFIKVCGHKISNQKKDIDKLFTLVDRASRNALRANKLWDVC